MRSLSLPSRFLSVNLGRCSVALLVLATLLAAPALHAQITGNLSGTVLDQSGALIPGAKITLLNEASADKRDSVSNSTGYFSFTGLLPSTYTITIEMVNFRSWQKGGIAVHPGDSVNVSDVKL